jgi:hypothetical protein
LSAETENDHMRTLGGIYRWVSSLQWTCRGRSDADHCAALKDGDARLNHPNVVVLHVEAADGRVLSLLVRDGRLKIHSDLPNEDAVRLVMRAIDFGLMPASDAAIFRVTVGGRTSAVRRVDGQLVHSGNLPTSLPARIFMASIAEVIEAKFGALMCGAVVLDGRRVRGHSCQHSLHREPIAREHLSGAVHAA